LLRISRPSISGHALCQSFDIKVDIMACWLFKFRPDEYHLAARLLDPNPVQSWRVNQHRDEILPGDIAFIWETGGNLGIRAVMRIDAEPRDMLELESEQAYWRVPETEVRCRAVGVLTHRSVNLSKAFLHDVPGLENMSGVFRGVMQGTNFPLTEAEGAILMKLVEQSGDAHSDPAQPLSGQQGVPLFEVGRVYERRKDIHARFGGQQQGGISTPSRYSCVFLFTGPSGEQHGYRDGWDDNGVFLYTGEGQSGDMSFVRGNLAIRDHAAAGRDLHLFESLGKGEGYRYVGLFDCVGWEPRRAPDTAGNDRSVIVFHLLPEGDVPTVVEQTALLPGSLEELRRRAFQAVTPPGDQPAREARRSYYERSTAVRVYVLVRAAGVCEACRQEAPFRRADGTPYLEPHHTRRIADGGPDHPRWVGAVCPNCHREVHHGENGGEVNQRLMDYLGTVETDA
jgi:5-methylcytosine-specific restriction enzyme A